MLKVLVNILFLIIYEYLLNHRLNFSLLITLSIIRELTNYSQYYSFYTLNNINVYRQEFFRC